MFSNEVYSSRSSGFSLMLSGGKIKPREYNERSGYGVRVLKGGKLGFAYAEKKEWLDKAIKAATATSKFSKETEFEFPQKAEYKKMKIHDSKIAELGAGGLKDVLDQIREGAEKYSKNTKIILGTGENGTKLENSAGFSGEYRDTSFSVYAEVMDGQGFGYYSNAFNYLPKDFTEMGVHAAELARKLRKPVKPKAGEYTVIFETEVVDDLIDVLLPSFLGDWKRRGISILANSGEKQIFDEKLSIYDDGTLSGTSGRPFDDEGIPSSRMPLVEKGVVKNFAYDIETAALEGVDRKGSCNRPGFEKPPGTGYSNIEVGKGEFENLEEIYPGAIVVYSLHGTHTANRTTGDFGVEVNAGWIPNDDAAVSGFMLTGNIFNLFKNIKGIEKKTKATGSFFSPRIAFGNMRVVS